MKFARIILLVAALVICLVPISQAAKSIEFSRVFPVSSGYFPQEVTPVDQMVENKFGLTLKKLTVPATDTTKLQAMIASGDVPDIMLIGELNQAIKLLSDKVIGDLTPLITKDKYPLLYARVTNKDYRPFIAYGGKLFSIPNPNFYTQFPHVPIYRKDIADDIALKLPTNLAEFSSWLAAIKKSGVKYPLTCCNGFNYGNLRMVFNAFGVAIDTNGLWHWNDAKKTAYCDDMTENMRKALAYLRQLKADGLLDADWSTQNEEVMFNKFVSGQAAFMQSWSVAWWRKEGNIEQYQREQAGEDVSKFDPDAWNRRPVPSHVDIFPRLKEIKAYQGWAPVWDRFVFSTKCVADKAKMAKILELAEWSLTKEGYIAVGMGQEGVDFKFNEKGYLTWLPGVTPDTRARKGFANLYYFGSPGDDQLEPPGDLDKPFDMKIRRYSHEQPLFFDINSYLVSKTWAEKAAQFAEKRDGIFYGIINGMRPVSDFDAWLKDAKALGYDACVKEFTAAYKAANKK